MPLGEAQSSASAKAPLSADGREKGAAPGQSPRYGRYLLIVMVVIAALLLSGWWPKHRVNEQVQAKANQQKAALPIVEVVTASEVQKAEELTLPGTVVPAVTSHIYARTTGYLKTLNVDIGDKVRRGQLLAIIDSPDLDATVKQQHSLLQVSKAALNTARSQLSLQQATYAASTFLPNTEFRLTGRRRSTRCGQGCDGRVQSAENTECRGCCS